MKINAHREVCVSTDPGGFWPAESSEKIEFNARMNRTVDVCNQYYFHTIRVLRKPRSDEALDILHRIADQVMPIMRNRKWSVPIFAEFFPKTKNLLGINVNHGQVIRIRLRPAEDESRFLPYEELICTTLHELVHIVRGPHDEIFWRTYHELKNECEELLVRRIVGKATRTVAANRLSSFTSLMSIAEQSAFAHNGLAAIAPKAPSQPAFQGTGRSLEGGGAAGAAGGRRRKGRGGKTASKTFVGRGHRLGPNLYPHLSVSEAAALAAFRRAAASDRARDGGGCSQDPEGEGQKDTECSGARGADVCCGGGGRGDGCEDDGGAGSSGEDSPCCTERARIIASRAGAGAAAGEDPVGGGGSDHAGGVDGSVGGDGGSAVAESTGGGGVRISAIAGAVAALAVAGLGGGSGEGGSAGVGGAGDDRAPEGMGPRQGGSNAGANLGAAGDGSATVQSGRGGSEGRGGMAPGRGRGRAGRGAVVGREGGRGGRSRLSSSTGREQRNLPPRPHANAASPPPSAASPEPEAGRGARTTLRPTPAAVAAAAAVQRERAAAALRDAQPTRPAGVVQSSSVGGVPCHVEAPAAAASVCTPPGAVPSCPPSTQCVLSEGNLLSTGVEGEGEGEAPPVLSPSTGPGGEAFPCAVRGIVSRTVNTSSSSTLLSPSGSRGSSPVAGAPTLRVSVPPLTAPSAAPAAATAPSVSARPPPPPSAPAVALGEAGAAAPPRRSRPVPLLCPVVVELDNEPTPQHTAPPRCAALPPRPGVPLSSGVPSPFHISSQEVVVAAVHPAPVKRPREDDGGCSAAASVAAQRVPPVSSVGLGAPGAGGHPPPARGQVDVVVPSPDTRATRLAERAARLRGVVDDGDAVVVVGRVCA